MGIYLNPGNVDFQEVLNSKIYVDKSELIQYTNSVLRTTQKYICVSPSTTIRKVYGSQYADGLLQPRL